MVAATKYQQFVEDLGKKVHNLDTDTLKLLLSNAAPTATHAVKADVTEISAGNGYSAGGPQLDSQDWEQTTGTVAFVVADEVITASGGSIGPFRTASMYNDTPTSPADPLIMGHDYGSSITLADGETLTYDVGSTIGGLT
jgi:hypothetical protein